MTKRLSVTLSDDDEVALAAFSTGAGRTTLGAWAAERGLSLGHSPSEAALLRVLVRAGAEALHLQRLGAGAHQHPQQGGLGRRVPQGKAALRRPGAQRRPPGPGGERSERHLVVVRQGDAQPLGHAPQPTPLDAPPLDHSRAQGQLPTLVEPVWVALAAVDAVLRAVVVAPLAAVLDDAARLRAVVVVRLAAGFVRVALLPASRWAVVAVALAADCVSPAPRRTVVTAAFVRVSVALPCSTRSWVAFCFRIRSTSFLPRAERSP